MYETVVNIEVWPQSFCIFVKDETCVDMWLKIKGINVEDSKCFIFVANNHGGVHIRFLQISCAWDKTVLTEFATQFRTSVSVVKNKLSNGFEDTTSEIVYKKAPLFLVTHWSLKVTNGFWRNCLIFIGRHKISPFSHKTSHYNWASSPSNKGRPRPWDAHVPAQWDVPSQWLCPSLKKIIFILFFFIVFLCMLV